MVVVKEPNEEKRKSLEKTRKKPKEENTTKTTEPNYW